MDFLRFLGERLGGRPQPGLVYLFLVYQVVVSALVFLFDSGFPAWIVLAGWAAFIALLAILVFRERNQRKSEEELRRRKGT